MQPLRTCAHILVCRPQKAVQGISGNTNPEIHLEGGGEADVPLLRSAGATSATLDDIAAGIGEVGFCRPQHGRVSARLAHIIRA